MVTITVSCPHCGSDRLARNDRAPNGKQKFRCKAYKKQSREIGRHMSTQKNAEQRF